MRQQWKRLWLRLLVRKLLRVLLRGRRVRWRGLRLGLELALSRDHYLTWGPDGIRDSEHERALLQERNGRDAWDFLSCLADDPASHAVIATLDGHLVGWLRFTLRRKLILLAQGTWVAKPHRSNGIATSLWETALRETQVTEVAVSVTSERGLFLMKSLQARHKSVRFSILV